MRVGCIGYATDQGLGHLVREFYDAGVITDVMIFQHPGGRKTHTEWYPAGTPVLFRRPFVGKHVDDFLRKIDCFLCFETPLDWSIVNRCKEAGVATACVAMYEWSLVRPPATFDLYLCPSLLDQDCFPTGEFIPLPVSPKVKWEKRTVARRFLHNAGHVGSRNHKGTDLVLRAAEHLKSSAELTVRCQSEATMRRLLLEMPKKAVDRVTIETGDVPYEQLWEGYDVLVQPERYNGASLPLQEALAAGMMVITTDRYPTNTWVPMQNVFGDRMGIRPDSYHRVSVGPGYMEIDEAVIDPLKIAERIDWWYGKDISILSEIGRSYARDNSWQALKPRYTEALEKAVANVKKAKRVLDV